jgi:guanylate kinase
LTETNELPVYDAHPLLIILSGPSGVGKDAVLIKLKQSGAPLHQVITATTRTKRPKEKDDVDYHFFTEEKFKSMIASDELLEWAKVYDNYYGVPKFEIREALNSGIDAIVKVDVQGATTIKKLIPDAVFIFIAPPSVQDLANRLQRRGETPDKLKVRLDTVAEEMKSLPIFDYIVVSGNNQLDLAAEQVRAIITTEKCRVKQRTVIL